jgi:hypothetical protein
MSFYMRSSDRVPHPCRKATGWGSWLVIATLTFLFTSVAHAQDIAGTVTNGTTNKPQSAAEVSLVDPMQGMAELGTAKSDSQGRFALKAPATAQGPRLVRVTHDGLNYFKMAPPGTNNIQVTIYDVAKNVEGISGTARVMRIQTTPDGNTLQVTELYAVNNASSPPRTLAAENSFEVALPEGAQIDGADGQGPHGQPLPVSPTPVSGKKNIYSISYALKPGETRFQVAYHLPYKGSADLAAHMTRAYEHFVIVLPPSIKWEPKSPALFKPMADQPGSTVQVASQVKAGQELAFRIRGTGTIADQQDSSADASGGGMEGQEGAQRSGPGGGLGAPIDAPDALERYRWVILGMLGVMLAGGAYLTVSRAGMQKQPVAASPTATAPASQPASASSNPLLDAMKEELFQLELERQKGEISDQEYQQQKAALDQTLARALAREQRAKA